MESILPITTTVSFGVLTVLLALSARKTGQWRPFFLEFIALVAFAVFLNRLKLLSLPFSSPEIAPKGDAGDVALAVIMATCMLLGMLSQFLYRHFGRPRAERPAFDWGMFIAPVFASPIVFIPLLTAFQNANVDLNRLTVPKLLIFVVAYQNGFFWKEFFDLKQREEASPK